MRAVEFGNGLSCFVFPELDGYSYGFNIYALESGSGVLLIDAAFRSQMVAVKKHLADKGLSITHVLASHFHNDHIAGLTALPESVIVMGSPDYKETLSKDIPQKVTLVSFTEPFFFGNSRLSFIPAPGHSRCSILTDINGKYLHAGDNLMGRYDGRRILPWVEEQCIASHIASLKMLREMKREMLFLSHGPMLRGRERIEEEIGLRLFYLERVLNRKKGLTLDEALPDGRENWVSAEFFHQLMKKTQ